MNKKIALIFGVTGQDGSYLSRLLLKKNYRVYGVKRKTSLINTSRIDDIYEDINNSKNFTLVYGDLVDASSINKIISKIMPDEIYNLAAQSHVAVSFDLPEYTTEVNALGTLRILETILRLKNKKKIKFYQAGTSELFGSTKPPQNENSLMHPQSPYAISKLYAHWITINYRNSYDLFATNGILFNHESPLRGETFVTRKIVKGLVRIKFQKQNILYLGNLSAKRDWGHAEDYVQAIWKIMQYKIPSDFVISSGNQYSVKEFIQKVSNQLKMKILWKGSGLKSVGYYNKIPIIRIKKKYYRPSEVNNLLGDSSLAKKQIKWKPKHTIESLIKDMINYEIKHI